MDKRIEGHRELYRAGKIDYEELKRLVQIEHLLDKIDRLEKSLEK